MSFDPVLWAMKDAPIANVEEWAVLACLAERADDDGTDAMPSQATIAQRTKLSPATVKRRMRALEERGLIRRGDQTLAERYPLYVRPVVWDLMIPYSWFPNIDRIQRYRAERGEPPLRRQDRPALAPAPEKARRADHGAPRDPGSSSTPGLQDPGALKHRGSTSPEGGVYKSGGGGLQDPQHSPRTLPSNTPQASEPDDASTTTVDSAPGEDQLPVHVAAAPASKATRQPKAEAPAPGATFEEFYAAYPRKAKPVLAKRAWEKAIKVTDPAVILAAAQRVAADPNLPELRFVSHPSSWLNAGGWEDPPFPSPGQSGNPTHQNQPASGWEFMNSSTPQTHRSAS